MNFPHTLEDKRAILDRVLPGHKKLSEAPASLEELPGYSCEFTVEELSRFKSDAIAEERRRRYKGFDAQANVCLFENPWPRRIETRQDGTSWVVRHKPQIVMSFAEAKRKAAQSAIADIAPTPESHSANPTASQDLQKKLDY